MPEFFNSVLGTFMMLCFFLGWFAFSGYAVVFAIKTKHAEATNKLKDDWPMLGFYYYGIIVGIMVVVGGFLSAIFWLALQISSG